MHRDNNFSWKMAAVCLIGFILFVGVVTRCKGETIPVNAAKYKRDMVRNARVVWGIDAPIAAIASQIHQESRWNPDARSKFAAGLAQFTPATATWIAEAFPDELAIGQPANPAWALRAVSRYDRYLWERVSGRTPCDRWAFTLSGYNGGPGWVARDKRLAAARGSDSEIWFGSVEKFNAGRSLEFFSENHRYPQRILIVIQPLYLTWGPNVPCVLS